MTLHTAQWGYLAKLLYKFFRPELQKIVNDTSNTVDNTVLDVADKLVGK